ncbi:hypothetical protein [Novacetimonas pomaceti]|uniref:hypothetical protein n=1 Tax=Novacetimonas pomaceti TaxID=2021998 RepID=UPI0014038843|nr:hypothetical protein [Novacetimonas pomaceti]
MSDSIERGTRVFQTCYAAFEQIFPDAVYCKSGHDPQAGGTVQDGFPMFFKKIKQQRANTPAPRGNPPAQVRKHA